MWKIRFHILYLECTTFYEIVKCMSPILRVLCVCSSLPLFLLPKLLDIVNMLGSIQMVVLHGMCILIPINRYENILLYTCLYQHYYTIKLLLQNLNIWHNIVTHIYSKAYNLCKVKNDTLLPCKCMLLFFCKWLICGIA